MGTPFVIDQEAVEKLKALAALADQNRIPYEEMKRRHDAYQRGETVETPNPGHEVLLPFGFKVVYTIEQHPLRGSGEPVWLRHMSMSSPRQGMAPIEVALDMVMRELGYTSPVQECMVYPEDIGPDHVAINVLEEIRKEKVA